MDHEAIATIKTYLGAGPSGGYQPTGARKRIERAFLQNHQLRLAKIAGYLDKDFPQTKWAGGTLAEEQIAFEALLARAFPELDVAAVNALACRWSFNQK